MLLKDARRLFSGISKNASKEAPDGWNQNSKATLG
jgi:hypothetical protein